MKKENKIIIAAVVLGAMVPIGAFLYSYIGTTTLAGSQTVEGVGYTMRLPGEYYEWHEDSYTSDNTNIAIDIHHYPNEPGFEHELMFRALLYNVLDQGDTIYTEKILVDEQEVWQAQYKNSIEADDGGAYYYAGIISMFVLENEFLVIDAYEVLYEAESDVSNKSMRMLNNIINSVEIADYVESNTKESNADMLYTPLRVENLILRITSNWQEKEEGISGYYDYGYYTSYQYAGLPIYFVAKIYNEDNTNDIEQLRTSQEFVLMGEYFLAGERALVFMYESYCEDGQLPYFYGMMAISEHYRTDLYVQMYEDDYVMSRGTIDDFIDFVLDVD